jgi:hypothetical protein
LKRGKKKVENVREKGGKRKEKRRGKEKRRKGNEK